MYLRPISLQLEVGLELVHEDVDGSVAPAEGHWLGIATRPGTVPQTFTFVKIDLGSSYSFAFCTTYAQGMGHKDGHIIGVRRNTCCKRASKKDTA